MTLPRRAFLAGVLPAALAACGADNLWATDEAIREVAVPGGPPAITLFTVIGIPRGEGGHSALMIDGNQRVIFDPAGTWNHPRIPERHDVLYGITENFRRFYIDYHARSTYWVAEDRVPVSLPVANAAVARAQAQGAANKAFCAVATSAVLRGLPGFEGAAAGFSPLRLRDWFLTLPGVVSARHRDGDPANNHDVLLRQVGGTITGYRRPV